MEIILLHYAPCRKMMPLINSLQIEYKDKITIIKINVDASKKRVKELKRGSLPYLAGYHHGEIYFDHYAIRNKNEIKNF